MALRDQPYIPLYVKDILTDEKLIECSPSSHGVYFLLICVLHKQEEYGVLKLKAKHKQNKSIMDAFSGLLYRFMPFLEKEIKPALEELIDEGVLTLDGDKLYQKRMVKDGAISTKRAIAGSKGGKLGRNSGTKRFYNEPGFLYLVYDKDDKEVFKMGISKEPDKRIKGIRRTSGRDSLAFRRKWEVDDMGYIEDQVLQYYNDIRDGEWLYGDYDVKDIEDTINTIVKSKANIKQNTAYATANANETANEDVNVPEDVKDVVPKIPYKEVIDDLNKKLGKNFKDTDKHKEKIRARFGEGHTLDDFKKVHDIKIKEWRGTDYEKHLKPLTLYGNKFNGYLNQPEANNTVSSVTPGNFDSAEPVFAKLLEEQKIEKERERDEEQNN